MINKTERLRGKKLLLEYKADINCQDLLEHLQVLFKDHLKDWKYLIKKEYYGSKDKVTVFAFIEVESTVDKYFSGFDLPFKDGKIRGVYKAGVDKEIVLMFLLKFFENKERVIGPCFITNIRQDEINFFTRTPINNENLKQELNREKENTLLKEPEPVLKQNEEKKGRARKEKKLWMKKTSLRLVGL